jgi:hypothetical protein
MLLATGNQLSDPYVVCPENNLARGRNFDTGTGCANGPFNSAFSYWSYLMRIGMEKLESDTALSKNLGSFQFLQKSRKRNVFVESCVIDLCGIYDIQHGFAKSKEMAPGKVL